MYPIGMRIIEKIKIKVGNKYQWYIKLENGIWYLSIRKKQRKSPNRKSWKKVIQSSHYKKSVIFLPQREIVEGSEEFLKLGLSKSTARIPKDLLVKFTVEEIVSNILVRYKRAYEPSEKRSEAEELECAIYSYNQTISEIQSTLNTKVFNYKKSWGLLNWNYVFENYDNSWYPDVSLSRHGSNNWGWMGDNRAYYFSQPVRMLSDKIPTDLDLISDILWETTFHGWVEHESKEFFDEMTKNIKELIQKRNEKDNN